MILTIDIGNTTVGISGVEREVPGGYRVVFDEKIPAKQRDLFPPITELLDKAGIDRAEIEGAAFSSVVPCLNEPMIRAIEGLIGKPPVTISADIRTGLSYAVPEPKRLGLDRIADSAWAAACCALPAITVDMGTATTFNVIGENRVFLGGMIASGVETSARSLSEHTAQLPEIGISAPARLIGKNTEECMLSGTVYGTAAMIDGIAARVEAELGKKATLILTGGWARFVEPLCIHPHIYEPQLLVKGLAYLYDAALNRDG